MHSNDSSTDLPQFDTCFDASAPVSFQDRAEYNSSGDFDPTLIDRNVTGANCTSTVTLIPSTATHGTASQLTITPSTGTSKYNLGDGQILVTFSHPNTDCVQNTWSLAFTSGFGVSLVVKIRKVSLPPQDPTDPQPPASGPDSVLS
jgi:hypothetical protein